MANFKQIAATDQVKIGGGKIYGIFVSSGSSTPTLAVYDSAVASTDDPKIANTFAVAAGTQYLSFPNGIFFSKGLYIVLANTAAFTVVYE